MRIVNWIIRLFELKGSFAWARKQMAKGNAVEHNHCLFKLTYIHNNCNFYEYFNPQHSKPKWDPAVFGHTDFLSTDWKANNSLDGVKALSFYE